MKQQSGKKIFGGIAIGKILVFPRRKQKIIRKKVANIQNEIERYEAAKAKAVEQLKEIYIKVLEENGESQAQIFEMHAMMLEDVEYNTSVHNLIAVNHINAEAAVESTAEHFISMFENMEDEYFRARGADIKDISERVLAILYGCYTDCNIGNDPVIIVADDLSPSETISIDKKKVLAFVTEESSVNSHTAILAKNMGIPAITRISVKESWNGKMAIVDGDNGKIILEPEEEIIKKYKNRQILEWEKKGEFFALKGQETMTLSGKKIQLCANIGNVADLSKVIKNDADGIGLFRSEFLYLERDSFPTEEEQFQIYRQLAEAMADKKVIIRTMDIGADKQAAYFDLPKEENPALGCRGIRLSLAKRDVFKTQLRAIFKASYYGNIAIMYPMITSLEEIREIKKILEEVKIELEMEKIPYGKVEQGIMIETPAAVVLCDFFAKEVDFFSIGTNDLIQYTLAVDRQNVEMEKYYNPWSEAVLRLIEFVVRIAHKAGIWVGICGELAADMELTSRFLEMGIDELSVSPAYILPLRKAIRELW
ncbi:MAG: phosphoenolpyruvate--protein phosphotransferase [Lachnospiraceae bacterium]|nr:phosphoenolpyruvate--protein phosphotransferase [Lachnospiraceae bacterium]